MEPQKLTTDFFRRDALEAAPALVGKLLCRRDETGLHTLRITQTEIYRGEEDTACHARFGRTARSEMLYRAGGIYYVYLCYGIHNMLNVITGPADAPQGVLIRACAGAEGPGKLTKALHITREFNGAAIEGCAGLWLADDGLRPALTALPRVGIGYASPEDQARLWRFVMADQGSSD